MSLCFFLPLSPPPVDADLLHRSVWCGRLVEDQRGTEGARSCVALARDDQTPAVRRQQVHPLFLPIPILAYSLTFLSASSSLLLIL